MGTTRPFARFGALATVLVGVAGCGRMGDPPPWWGAGNQSLYCDTIGKPLEVGQIEVSENRDPDAVQRVLMAHFESLQGCYQSTVYQDPDSEGTAVVRIDVQPSGKVASACIEERRTPDTTALQCMLYEIRRMTFEPASGPTVIRMPLEMVRLPA